MPNITHPDIASAWVLATLRGDAPLNAMTVTMNGSARALQGVFYMRADQERESPYPCVIVGQPILWQAAQKMHPNSGNRIAQATFLEDVRCVARDISPESADFQAIRARVQELLEGKSANVTGGRINSTQVERYLPDLFTDDGTFQFPQIGLTLRLDVQLN